MNTLVVNAKPERARPERPRSIHPAWMRITHWLNAIAVVIMVMSGWKIYNASPIFSFKFPGEITLGGWLGGAIQWHFAAMWLFAFNGLVYLAINIFSGRLRVKFFPINIRGVIGDMKDALRGKLAHDDLSKYNMVQKIAYLLVTLALVILVLSGLAVWKPVQFPLLLSLMGDFDNARIVHFWAMAFVVSFLAVHLLMVVLVPRTLLTMIRGK
jgi:thiosulfate reductase cytochrome b subunit